MQQTSEQATLEEMVFTAAVLVGRQLRQRHPGDEIEFSSLAMLRAVEREGPLRLSALAVALHLDASTVSRQVRTLEERGLLERTTDPGDGRANLVALTSPGRRCLEDGATRRRDLIADRLADWSDKDRAALHLMMQRLSASFMPGETDLHD